jgi:hypothetical protein
MGVTAPKVSKGRSQTSFVFMPFGRVSRRETLCDKQNQAANYLKSRAALPQKKRHLIHGDDPVSTGVVEGGISEPWPLTTIKRGT